METVGSHRFVSKEIENKRRGTFLKCNLGNVSVSDVNQGEHILGGASVVRPAASRFIQIKHTEFIMQSENENGSSIRFYRMQQACVRCHASERSKA